MADEELNSNISSPAIQGETGSVGSLNDGRTEQQVVWNNNNPIYTHNMASEFITSNINIGSSYLNPASQVQTLSAWNIGESGFSGTQNHAIQIELNREDGSNNDNTVRGANPNQSSGNVALIQNGSNHTFPENLNISENSSNSWQVVVGNTRGPSSARGSSSNRMAVDGYIGNIRQSSSGGSSDQFQPRVANGWNSIPGFRNVNISASESSTPSEDLTVASGPSGDNTSGNPIPRFSEYIRRPSSESEGQNSNSHVQTGSSLQQVSASSGAGLRSALTSETQLQSAPGGTSSWPSAAGGLEWRIVSEDEFQSVLNPMRRGEGLRMEDMAILDQSIFTEMVNMNLNDGHRDMRLDVDNMSDDEDMPNLEQSIFTELAEILDGHRDMRLDIDNMSYEELLALEEGLGDVNTGLSDETIENQLKHRKFSSDPCCICQENYNDGDDIGAVECGHEFHSGCIKQWLKLKNSCPICKALALKN